MRMYITPYHFVFQYLATGAQKQLAMERSSGRVACTQNFNPLSSGVSKDQLYYYDVFAMLGMIKGFGTDLVLVVSEA